MSARNDYTDVQDIVTTSLTSGQITALIETAAVWVDEHLVDVTDLSEAALTQIEKYIAAHLVVGSGESGSGQRVEARRADISEKYAEDKGRDTTGATSYIRTAAALDPTGRVAEAWLKGKRVRWRVGDGYNFIGAGG